MWYEAQPGGMHYIITPCDLDCDLDETSLATAVRTRAIISLPPGLRTTLRLVTDLIIPLRDAWWAAPWGSALLRLRFATGWL